MVRVLDMKGNPVLRIDGNDVRASLQKAGESLVGDVVLDLSLVHTIDANGLRALQEFSSTTETKKIKVTLRGVNVTLYKALKLARVARSFDFVN